MDRSDFEASYLARRQKVEHLLASSGVEKMLLTLGRELPWLTGYEAMPLERTTCLVVDSSGMFQLLIPKLEAPRVRPLDGLELLPWQDGQDPFDIL